ncbi:MAG: hypothetical protein ABIG93_02465 [archaeon]
MKEIIILGDVEMGGGTLTDDFVSDKALSELILELANKPHPVDIVFNGDTFDLLKCPIIIEALNNEGQPIQKRAFPRHITEEISLQKLKLVHQAHKPVFGALGDYLKKSNKHVFFVLGNHDHDLMFKGVQKEIKNILCDKNRDIRNQVHFPGLKYRYGQVLAEHGHQYDFLNQVDIEHWYLIYKNKRILNIPWVSFGVVSKFMEMKEQHPLMERTFPRPALFSKHDNLLRQITFKSSLYLLHSFVYYPFRYRHDPTYTFPRELLREFYRRLKNVHFDVDKIMGKFQRKRKRMKRKFKIHILGHVHDHYLEEKDGEVYIHPGSWRDEYDLDENSGMLFPRTKKYIRIIVNEENPSDLSYELVVVPNQRKSLNFDAVRMDEHSFVEMIRKEEGKLN